MSLRRYAKHPLLNHLKETRDARLASKGGTDTDALVSRIKVNLKLQLVVLILLSLGLILTIGSNILGSIPGYAEVEAGLNAVETISASASGLLTVLLLLLRRIMYQHQLDWSRPLYV